MSDWNISKTENPTNNVDLVEMLVDPSFGTKFTDHMAVIDYDSDVWKNHRVVPYAKLELDPACAVLHYSQEIFEGLKAYRRSDDSVWLFRPYENAKRFQASAERLCLPVLSEQDFVDSVVNLVQTDLRFVPTGLDKSLYLRPFMFASETFLGVHAAKEVEYICIASPVGAYFKGGPKPVSIWVSTDLQRTGPGVTGFAKTGGNYAASLLPQKIASENGCDQVLFIDSVQHRYLEELGGMNVFVIYKDGLIKTPPTGGNILKGITRDSIIQLFRHNGENVEEGNIDFYTLIDDIRKGEVIEMFACGTAAVVSPIGTLKGEMNNVPSDSLHILRNGERFDESINGGNAGTKTLAIREQLVGIQTGESEDIFGWCQKVSS